MAKRKYKPFIRGKFGSTAEVMGPGGQYEGTEIYKPALTDPYLMTSKSEGGRRYGPFQFYRRGKYSGKYQKKRPGLKLPGLNWRKKSKKFVGLPDEEDVEPTAGMRWTWDRDIRLLVCIGTTIAAFILCYVVMNIVFDAVGESMVAVGISTDMLDSFRVQASLVLGVVTALIVGVGASMFLFKEGEVDDSAFEA